MKSESIKTFELTMSVIMIILIIMAILCNLLIIIALTRPFHRRAFRDYILLIMAFNDLILILTGGCLEVRALLSHHFDMDPSLCVFESFIVLFLEYVSLGFLFILVLDRYLTVCKPLAALQVNQDKSFAMLCITINIFWSFVWAIMPVLGFGKYGLQNGQVQCGLIPNNDTKGKFYVTVLMICIFVIPSIIMLILFREIRRKFHHTDVLHNSSYGDIHQDDKDTMTFLQCLVIAFGVTWLPYNILITVEVLTDSPASEVIEVIGMLLAYSSALVIPCISLIYYKELQKTAKVTLKKTFSGNSIVPHQQRFSSNPAGT